MRRKIEFLRDQAEIYWRDAEAAKTEQDALRLCALALRCHELVLVLERELKVANS